MDAWEACQRFRIYEDIAHLEKAWKIYTKIWEKLVKIISSLTSLDLEMSSPQLLNARDLELAVPGESRCPCRLSYLRSL